MPVAFSFCSVVPLSSVKLWDLNLLGSITLKRNLNSSYYNHVLGLSSFRKRLNLTVTREPFGILKVSARNHNNNLLAQEGMDTFDWRDQEEIDIQDEESPWEGSIIYRRNPSASHVEYCTTLERLGLAKLSTDLSKSRASVMGLRVMKDVKDYPGGTPVLISLDVARKKKKLRLDGIIRTVITLGCNRCGEPAAENIFSNFSLLLSEEPIEEPETINMGVLFGEDKFKTFGNSVDDEEYDDDLIDSEDQLYFPPEEKAVDISKHIRDLLHLEITINAVCNPDCRGLCLKCGINLNVSSCRCHTRVDEKSYGPLGGLRKQMQQK